MVKKDGLKIQQMVFQSKYHGSYQMFLHFRDLIFVAVAYILEVLIYCITYYIRTSRGTSTQQERPYKSEVSGKAKGPNPSLRKGPNDDLLL